MYRTLEETLEEKKQVRVWATAHLSFADRSRYACNIIRYAPDMIWYAFEISWYESKIIS